LVSHSLVF